MWRSLPPCESVLSRLAHAGYFQFVAATMSAPMVGALGGRLTRRAWDKSVPVAQNAWAKTVGLAPRTQDLSWAPEGPAVCPVAGWSGYRRPRDGSIGWRHVCSDGPNCPCEIGGVGRAAVALEQAGGRVAREVKPRRATFAAGVGQVGQVGAEDTGREPESEAGNADLHHVAPRTPGSRYVTSLPMRAESP